VLGGAEPVLERPLFPCITPKHFIILVGIERRVDIDQVDAIFRKIFQMLEAISAIDDGGF
jgi:hypothetical protein